MILPSTSPVAGLYTNRVGGIAARIAFGGVATDAATPLLLKDIISRLSDGVTGITSGYEMFRNAANITQFTQADWFDATSTNVTTMWAMFNGASKFNGVISGWNVSKVVNMSSMFLSASKFNYDIGEWDVSSVTNMWRMFNAASAFKQDVSHWNVSKVENFTDFLKSSSLPTDLYNQLLIRWSHLPLKSGLTFHGGDSTYDEGLPAECRERIINIFGWTFVGDKSTNKPFRPPPTVFGIR